MTFCPLCGDPLVPRSLVAGDAPETLPVAIYYGDLAHEKCAERALKEAK